MPSSTVVRPGGLILVTGVNGFLGSHLANMLLERGYAVRGSVRSEEKAAWVKEVMTMRHPSAHFEIVVVPDIAAAGVFDHYVKGCDGVAHVASDLSFKPDPNQVITPMVEGVKNILQSVTKEPSIKRFVMTSSSIAALTPQPEKEIKVDFSTWNDTSIERAWRPPPYEQERMWDVYAASKTQCERELWKFAQEQKPSFALNAVLPDFIVGPIFHAKQPGSTGRWVKAFFDDPNHYQPLQNFVPQYFVDVEDTVLLHIAALTEEDVRDERLLGFAEPFNFNSWVGAFRKIDPSKPWPADDPKQQHDLSKPNTTRALELLKRYDRNGWTPFYDSVRRNCLESAPGS